MVFGAETANAAILYFSPSSENFTVGNVLSASVLVNTQGQAINNSDAVINFPAGLLEVVSISKSGSIFSLWIEEPTFSNSAGTITLSGGLSTPGFNGTAGKILNVVFRTRVVGTASLIFSSAAVRANDGYGTNILSSLDKATYSIIPSVTPSIKPTGVLSIESTTHPDQNKWYSNNNPIFQTKFPSDATELNMILNLNEKATPQVKYIPPISEKILKDVSDGVWYLHVNYRGRAGLSPTIKYKIQIDTGLPKNLKIMRIYPDDVTNLSPKFELSAEDSLSGIDYYAAKIDDGKWVKLFVDGSGNYSLPVQTPGKKQLTIRVYDQAGNYIESSQKLQIDSTTQPIESCPVLNTKPITRVLSDRFNVVINFISNSWILLITILMVVGAAMGQLILKGISHLTAKIKFVVSQSRVSKKLKRLDRKKTLELKAIEKDIKKELELLVNIAGHSEHYLKNELEKFYNILKKL